MKRRLISFLLATMVIFQICLNAAAMGRVSTEIARDIEEITSIIDMLKQHDQQYSVLENKLIEFDSALYAPNGNSISARLYCVYTQNHEMLAYFIVNSEGGLSEFALSNITPYEQLKIAFGEIGQKVYTGFMCGLNINGTVRYQNEMTVTAFQSRDSYHTRSADALTMPAIYLQNGPTCIPTSIAHYLLFYSTIYPQTCNVTNQSSFTALADTIADLMVTVGGSYQAQAPIEGALSLYCQQINSYSSTTPLTFSYTSTQYPSFMAVRRRILSDLPCLIGFASGGAYSDGHMTLCIDAYILGNNDYYMITVVDGWGLTATTHVWNETYNDYIGKLDISLVE